MRWEKQQKKNQIGKNFWNLRNEYEIEIKRECREESVFSLSFFVCFVLFIDVVQTNFCRDSLTLYITIIILIILT